MFHFIPDELLLEILRYTWDFGDSLPASRALATVCKKWYIIVHRHPDLFSFCIYMCYNIYPKYIGTDIIPTPKWKAHIRVIIISGCNLYSANHILNKSKMKLFLLSCTHLCHLHINAYPMYNPNKSWFYRFAIRYQNCVPRRRSSVKITFAGAPPLLTMNKL